MPSSFTSERVRFGMVQSDQLPHKPAGKLPELHQKVQYQAQLQETDHAEYNVQEFQSAGTGDQLCDLDHKCNAQDDGKGIAPGDDADFILPCEVAEKRLQESEDDKAKNTDHPIVQRFVGQIELGAGVQLQDEFMDNVYAVDKELQKSYQFRALLLIIIVRRNGECCTRRKECMKKLFLYTIILRQGSKAGTRTIVRYTRYTKENECFCEKVLDK